MIRGRRDRDVTYRRIEHGPPQQAELLLERARNVLRAYRAKYPAKRGLI